MSWFNIFGIAVGLSMDALAVSLASGVTIRRVTHGHVFRLAFCFGLFQFMMPVIGYFAGRTVSDYVEGYDHWLAFGLLTLIGTKMLWEAWAIHKPENRGTPTRGLLLLTLSIATSIDALAAGLSMAFIDVSIWTPSAVIGLVAAGFTAAGMYLGGHVGQRFGKLAEIVGGLVLIGIGMRILTSHLAAGQQRDSVCADAGQVQGALFCRWAGKSVLGGHRPSRRPLRGTQMSLFRFAHKTVGHVLRITAGVILLLIGIAGLVLPILPGWVFIGAAIVVLAPDTRLAEWLKGLPKWFASKLRLGKCRKPGPEE